MKKKIIKKVMPESKAIEILSNRKAQAKYDKAINLIEHAFYKALKSNRISDIRAGKIVEDMVHELNNLNNKEGGLQHDKGGHK